MDQLGWSMNELTIQQKQQQQQQQQQQLQLNAQSMEQDMIAYEQICNVLYGLQQPGATKQVQVTNSTMSHKEASQKLEAYNKNSANLPNLKYFIEKSNNQYAKYLAASALKQLLTDQWHNIQLEEKTAIRQYLLSYLMSEDTVLSHDKQVVKMMMLLLARITKLGWFDDADIKNSIVPELTKILDQKTAAHRLIGFEALDQLIMEMTYMTQTKNLSLNRRVSLNFRDVALYQIFSNNLKFVATLTNMLQQDINSGNFESMSMTLEQLEICLQTYHKALTFDYVAVLLNETMEDPCQTNLPSAWATLIEEKSTLDNLFNIIKITLVFMQQAATQHGYIDEMQKRQKRLKSITLSAFRCLTEYANVRQSLFSTEAAKCEYVKNFATNFEQILVNTQIGTPEQAVGNIAPTLPIHAVIFSNISMFRESLRMLHKFQNNFGSRSLINTKLEGLLDMYLQTIFQYSVEALMHQTSTNLKLQMLSEYMAHMNQVWYRQSLESGSKNESQQKLVEKQTQALIQIQIDEWLKFRGDQQAVQRQLEAGDEEAGDDSDCSEGSGDFHQGQRTQKFEDYDQFARLMRLRMEFSVALMLDRVTQLLAQYEETLNLIFNQNQNDVQMRVRMLSIEKQLGQMIQICNAFFSFGLPSSSSKLPVKYASAETLSSDIKIKARYDDFSLISKFITLMSHLNQLKYKDNNFHADWSLENGLIHFIQCFKSNVLGDPRIILLGASARADSNEKKNNPGDSLQDDNSDDEDVEHFYPPSPARIESDAYKSYNSIAQIMEKPDMKTIMTIFAEKILLNLAYTKPIGDLNKKNILNSQGVINLSLDILAIYTGSAQGCRMLGNTDIMKQLVTNGLSNFQILQQPSQMKKLGQFYKVLMNLWLQEDVVSSFDDNISQLNTVINEILVFQDINAMRQDKDMKLKVMQIFHILRGLFRGASNHKNFLLVFDWFYPEFFGIVKKCLTVYSEPCDDEVVLLIFKLLNELVDNSTNRLKFDAWSINGLIIYKESASFMIEFMQKFQGLSSQGKPLKHNDVYKEIYKYIKVFIGMMHCFISGRYINFAICEYYNDQTFTHVSQLVFQSIISQDLASLHAYNKLNRKLYSFIEEFFKNHLELIFLRFDFQLVMQVIERSLIPGVSADLFEVRIASLQTIDSLNTFIFENLRRPSKKQPSMSENVHKFYTTYQQIYKQFLRAITYALLFEDHANIWVFQRSFHSSIIMCEGGAQQGVHQSYKLIMEVVHEHERNQARKERVIKEIDAFLGPGGSANNGFPTTSLDTRSREQFQAIFAHLKQFLHDYGQNK